MNEKIFDTYDDAYSWVSFVLPASTGVKWDISVIIDGSDQRCISNKSRRQKWLARVWSE